MLFAEKKIMDKIVKTAKTILAAFENISETASENLKNVKHVNVVYTNENFFEKERVRKEEQAKGLKLLQNIPAKYRFVLSRNGETKTVYVSPGYDFSAFENSEYQVINNVSAIGRLANQADVGEEIGFGDWVLVEKQAFSPKKENNFWDGKENTFYEENATYNYMSLRSIEKNVSYKELNNSNVKNIDSFKEKDEEHKKSDNCENESYLKHFAVDFQQLISEQSLMPNQSSKLGTITYLDKIQSEVESFPLNCQFVLMGPPGTGKTTTLIRRLKYQLYENREKNSDIERNWILFTPTKLLREYIYKAINKEQIPIPSNNVKTWEDFIAPFSSRFFLNTPKEHGKFVLGDDCFECCITNVKTFFDSFFKWQGREYVKILVETYKRLQNLCENGKARVVSFERFSFGHIQSIQEKDIINVINETIPSEDGIDYVANCLIKDFLDNSEALSDILNKLYKIFSDGIYEEKYNSWINIIRKYNVKLKEKLSFDKKNQGTKERIRKLEELISKSEEKIKILSEIVKCITLLEKPMDAYAENIHKRYISFLNEYKMTNLLVRKNKISKTERDILALAILKTFKAFSKSNHLFYQNKQLEYFSKNIVKLQIFVDEMTDFSPLQIACMFQLSDKNMNSFFAGGDFNQRLTSNGCANEDDLYWAIGKNIRIRKIEKNYRLSPKLDYLASVILNENSSVDINSDLYAKSPNPIWLKNADNLNDIADWLVKNIGEIYERFDAFPSIAVLVGTENAVLPVAEVLQIKGADAGFCVEACVQGQAIGTETNIRVFDIHHIKGLEFEAAFFVSLDKMFVEDSSEIVRYLYVGATRAANFLGITTSTSLLPMPLQQCTSLFKEVF